MEKQPDESEEARASELAAREELAHLREEARRARAEADAAQTAREELLQQMRDVNERLVLAALRADELLQEAAEARARAERAEAQAQAASRAKDEFLAMLGHELRNPLAPIRTALELVQMRDPEAFARERAIMARHLQHLVHLVDDLLDISRITGGKIELHRETIELAAVVARAVELASPLLETKAHELVVDVPRRGLPVDGDATRLVQIVANLLTNAAKFTPPRGTITVTGERRGARVALRVRDTGVGISAQMLPRVFDLFSQERQPADRSQGGLGIGLAIVRSLVEMHGGSAAARSDGPGRGSEFTVELPASGSAAVPDVPRQAAAPDDAEAARPRLPGALKVLVVDDNQDAAELMMEFLAGYGHEVRGAFDGPSALAIVEDFAPEVALLDIGLPVMDGHELAQRMRAIVPATRLVAITGYGQAIDRARSAEAGFSLHLVKPVDLKKLQEGLHQLMGEVALPSSR